MPRIIDVRGVLEAEEHLQTLCFTSTAPPVCDLANDENILAIVHRRAPGPESGLVSRDRPANCLP